MPFFIAGSSEMDLFPEYFCLSHERFFFKLKVRELDRIVTGV
jgi:hypothetical protein